ncbi:MAG: hypothetical protein RLN89_01270, partial [Parvibaculum sp.]
MPTFDLSTKVVDLGTSIWVVHPGRSRRFFNHFYEHNVLFLELPGLNISLEALKKTETVRQHIRMSLAFMEYYGGRSREGKKVPSANPRSYDGSAGDGQLASLVGSARKLFAVAKRGDLVIVPGKGGTS